MVDATDYYRTAWLRCLQDTDANMAKFYRYCISSGPSKCSLAQIDSTPASIERALESLLTSLKDEPIAVPATATRGPEIITYSGVMDNIGISLYTPFTRFSTMAILLSDLIYGNGSTFAGLKQNSHDPSCPIQSRGDRVPRKSCQDQQAVEATWGILCSDGQNLNHLTKAGFKNYIEVMKEQGKWIGESRAVIPMNCIHWKGKTK
jgi:hypothetical protein